MKMPRWRKGSALSLQVRGRSSILRRGTILLFLLLGCDKVPAQQQINERMQCFWYKEYCFCTLTSRTSHDYEVISFTFAPDPLCEK